MISSTATIVVALFLLAMPALRLKTFRLASRRHPIGYTLQKVLALTGLLTLSATGALAQTMSLTATPATFSTAGQLINFDITVHSGGFDLIAFNGIEDGNEKITPNCAFPGNVPPGGSFNCTATYTTTATDMAAGNIVLLLSASGQHVGGNWSVATTRFDVPRAGGGGTNTTVSVNPTTSQYGQNVTFTAIVTPNGGGTPTGSVEFAIGPFGSPLLTGTATLSGNTATYTTNSIPAGTHSFQASYQGDGDYGGSIGLSGGTLTVDRATTTTVITSSRNPADSNQSVVITAAVSSDIGLGTATGTVSFRVDGSTPFDIPIDANGNASVIIGDGEERTYTITAEYGGDTNLAGSTATPFVQVFTRPPITIAPATLSAGEVGAVYFAQLIASDGTAPYSFSSADAPAWLTVSAGGLISGLPTMAGSYPFTVTATDNTNYTGSVSYTLVVDEGDTVTALASSLNPSSAGDSVTFTATVTAASGGGVPTGSVTFGVDGAPQPPVALDAGGTAALTISTLLPRTYQITAEYSGDANYLASDESLTQTVDWIASTVGLVSSQNPSIVGDSITFTATVSSAASAFVPTGSVSFTVNGVTEPSVLLDANGEATFTTDQLPIGTNGIIADYDGDDMHWHSSTAFTQTVDQIGTTTALVSSQNPSNAGEPVVFTATVTGGPGGGTPTGSVVFEIDGLSQPAVPLNVNGRASFSADTLAPGPHTIVARYSGDADYTISEALLLQFVEVLGTTTTLVSSQNPSNAGENVTFTATVTTTSGASTPTGTMKFSIDGVPQAPVALNNAGQAIFSTVELPDGLTNVAADYSGDTNFTASSDSLVQVVMQDGTTTTIVSSQNPSGAGDSVEFTATVTAQSGSGIPTGFVTFFIDGSSQTSASLGSGGVATFSTNRFVPGANLVTAQYSGDQNHLGSSRTLTQTVGQIATTTTLVSSANPSDPGQPVTFTATVVSSLPGNEPDGAVTFTIDGSDKPPVELSGGLASFTTVPHSGGDFSVTATYVGTASHTGSASPQLVQRVRSLGTVVIRQTASGSDGTFAFTSPTAGLNLSLATSGGQAQSVPIQLPAGVYSVTAQETDGFALVAITCSDPDSLGNVEARTASITLAAGEAVTCTFASLNSAEQTTQMIGALLEARGGIIMSHQTDMQRRIDRLNGVAPSMGNPVSMLSSYLPGMIDGGALSMSTSLAQIDRLAGNEQPSRFDVWFDATYGRFDTSGEDGRFAIAALGADYLINRNLLVGAFLQVDHLRQSPALDGSFVRGTGWLAGPYATSRLSEHLFLDLVAAAGTSGNDISPFGTYVDGFDTFRWLASARLTGHWTHGAWTFTPQAGFSWFSEQSRAYIDSLGVAVPTLDVGIGQFAFGPGIAYRHMLEGGTVIEPNLRLEAVSEFRRSDASENTTDFYGRINAGTDVRLPAGAAVGLSLNYSGIGGDTKSYGARLRVSVPLQ